MLLSKIRKSFALFKTGNVSLLIKSKLWEQNELKNRDLHDKVFPIDFKIVSVSVLLKQNDVFGDFLYDMMCVA